MPWVYRMTLTLFLVAIPIFIYIGLRLASAITLVTATTRIKISKKKAIIFIFLFILWFYLWPLTLLISKFTGNVWELFVFNLHLEWQDYLIVFPSWWGLISLVEIFPYYVVMDIFALVRRSKKFSGRNLLSYMKVIIALFFLTYVGVRTFIDTNYVHISNSEIIIPDLPERLNGLRLSFFGDIHMSRFTQEKNLGVLKNELKSGKEDLIFFSGDLTSTGQAYIQPAINMLSEARSGIGNIACMGDHDFWTAPDKIARELKNGGWKFLQNQHHLFIHKGQRILVTGVTHVYSKRIRKHELENLLSNAPEADLKILLVHQPREFIIETAARHKYHLLLAGHTHGGEVVNHLFGIPYSPGLRESRYSRGKYRFKDLQIVVTNGIGRTLALLRYHAPSHITKLILKKKLE